MEGAGRWRRLRPVDWAVLVGLLLLVVVLAVLRWSGQPPFGSDSDEYQMVAEAIWSTGKPLVAGVEGTKYPVGWPLVVGALDRVGLPLPGAALVLNVLFVAGAVTVVWYVAARRFGTVAGGVAGLLVALSPTLWDSVYVVMPDAALTLVMALAVAAIVRIEDERRVWWLVGLGVLVAALKTVGVVIAGMLGLALLLRPRVRRWFWAPPAAALVVTALQALWTAGLPEHTTGYGATFWLADPYDASQGKIGVGGLLDRLVGRVDDHLTDVARAVFGGSSYDWLGIVIVLGLVVVLVVRFRRLRWPVVGFLGVYTVVLAIWPYRSPRFGLPWLPLAALGAGATAGWLVGHASALLSGRRVASTRPPAGPSSGRPDEGPPFVLLSAAAGMALLGLVAGLAVHADRTIAHARHVSAVEADNYRELHDSVADAVEWMEDNLPPDATLASFDYREIAFRSDYLVLPLGYTTDTEELLAASRGRGADHLVVVRGLYGLRQARTEKFLADRADRLERVYSNARVDVYRFVDPEASA